MRIIVMGTGGFAVPTLRFLLSSEHQLLALVTRPPRPIRGHGGEGLAPNPMRDLAQAAGLEVWMPEGINEPSVIARLRACQPGLLVVCDYGQILKRDTLATASLGGINLHASLLPRYRGAAPVNWALYQGEATTGVTVIHMTPLLDGGPCLVQLTTPIGPTEDAIQLERRLAELGVAAVREALDQLTGWDGEHPLGTPQDGAAATRAPRLQKADGLVDWCRTAGQIFNQVRAFKPWPGTYTHWCRPKAPLRLLLDQVEVATDGPAPAGAGTVVRAQPQDLQVACGRGTLRLLGLQPSGKRRMEAGEFLRGYPLRVGDQLT